MISARKTFFSENFDDYQNRITNKKLVLMLVKFLNVFDAPSPAQLRKCHAGSFLPLHFYFSSRFYDYLLTISDHAQDDCGDFSWVAREFASAARDFLAASTFSCRSTPQRQGVRQE